MSLRLNGTLRMVDPSFLKLNYPSALVLVQETRTCAYCGSKQVLSGSDLMIEFTRIRGRAKCLKFKWQVPPIYQDLEQKLYQVSTSVEACLSCFEETHPQQLSFFSWDTKRLPAHYTQVGAELTKENLNEFQGFYFENIPEDPRPWKASDWDWKGFSSRDL